MAKKCLGIMLRNLVSNYRWNGCELSLRKLVLGTALFFAFMCVQVLYRVREQDVKPPAIDRPEFDYHGRRTQFVQPRSSKQAEGRLLKRKDGSKNVVNMVSQNEEKSKVVRLKSRPTELNDVYITVKTSQKFHDTRVRILLDTWVSLAREQTFFFTDKDDPELEKKTNGHVINTKCPQSHGLRDLLCKMGKEYDYFLESKKRWFCHVDDDTYVNVPQLVKLLQGYNHTKEWYLGKPSINHPLQIPKKFIDPKKPGVKPKFWFGTGGAGFCISQSLAVKMVPLARGGRLMREGLKISMADDCTVAYIIHQVGTELTVVPSLHSHLEPLWMIKGNLTDQITFSYKRSANKLSIVEVDGFSPVDDPTRLYSLHCHLFPLMEQCERVRRP